MIRFTPALVLLAAAPAVAQDGNKVALIVGVNDYDHPKLPPLKFAGRDATELAKVLADAKYDATVLTSAGKTKPTRADIKAALKATLAKCKRRGDMVLVALAGHGLQFAGDKMAYFCPQDANPSDKDTLLPLQSVVADLDASFAGVKLMLVDACRNDPKESRGIDVDGIRPPKGVASLFSCSAGERAYEDKSVGGGHGIFFHHVIEGLRGGAKDEDGEVTWQALAGYVQKRVPKTVAAAIGDGARQNPSLNAGELSGTPPVLVAIKAGATPKTTPKTTPEPKSTPADGETAGSKTEVRSIKRAMRLKATAAGKIAATNNKDEVLWSVEGKGSGTFHGMVVCVDDSFLCVYQGNVLRCIELATGKEQWSSRTKTTADDAEIAYRGNHVIVKAGESRGLRGRDGQVPARLVEVADGRTNSGRFRGKYRPPPRSSSNPTAFGPSETPTMFARSSLALMLLAAPASAQDGKRYAVLVGVNDYDHAKLAQLKYAEADATALRDLLKAAGYDAKLLTTAEGKRSAAAAPTKANVERAVKAALDGSKRGDTVLVALAGHGVQFEGGKGAYFCPQDGNPSADKADTLVSLAGLFKLLDDSGAGVKLMLVDACRNDPKASRGIDAAGAPRAPAGVAALFSCSNGERAYESPKYKHGVFFHHVLEVLAGKHPRALNKAGEVTWDGLQTAVRELVSDDVPDLIGDGARQTPALNAGELRGKSPPLLAPRTRDAQAAFDRAADYRSGRGAAKDDRAAAEWLAKAADLGHAAAANDLGCWYRDGHVVAKDERKAVELFAKSADRGESDAMKHLGQMYADGRGVPKDEGRAFEWFRRSAEGGNADGMKHLGAAYERGRGVGRDEKKAAEWLRRSADGGNAGAAFDLASLYAAGRGVAGDEAKAAEWFRRSADGGNSFAMAKLAARYEAGVGVARNLAEAVAWYRKAAAAGDGDAKAALKRLGKE